MAPMERTPGAASSSRHEALGRPGQSCRTAAPQRHGRHRFRENTADQEAAQAISHREEELPLRWEAAFSIDRQASEPDAHSGYRHSAGSCRTPVTPVPQKRKVRSPCWLLRRFGLGSTYRPRTCAVDVCLYARPARLTRRRRPSDVSRAKQERAGHGSHPRVSSEAKAPFEAEPSDCFRVVAGIQRHVFFCAVDRAYE
jgi:hypothetical protein